MHPDGSAAAHSDSAPCLASPAKRSTDLHTQLKPTQPKPTRPCRVSARRAPARREGVPAMHARLCGELLHRQRPVQPHAAVLVRPPDCRRRSTRRDAPPRRRRVPPQRPLPGRAAAAARGVCCRFGRHAPSLGCSAHSRAMPCLFAELSCCDGTRRHSARAAPSTRLRTVLTLSKENDVSLCRHAGGLRQCEPLVRQEVPSTLPSHTDHQATEQCSGGVQA